MATIAGCEDCVASACRRFVRLRSGFVRPLFVVSPCGRRRVCGGARGAGAIIANQSLVGAAGAAGAASGCSLVQPHPLGSSALAFARASARAFAAQRLAAGSWPRLGGRKAGRLQAGRRVGLLDMGAGAVCDVRLHFPVPCALLPDLLVGGRSKLNRTCHRPPGAFATSSSSQ